MTTPLNPLPIQKIEGKSTDTTNHTAFFPPPLDTTAPAAPTPPPIFTTFLSSDKKEEPSAPPPVEEPPPISETEIRVMQLEKMLQEAKAHAEQQENDAYNTAYANGEKAGTALAKDRANATIEQFDLMLQQAQQQMLHIQRATADAIIDIAQMITETLIGEVNNNQREWLLNAATKVAENLPSTNTPLQLAVNPEDLTDIKKIIHDENRAWQIVSDPTLNSGCCRLISPQQDAFIDPLHAVAELVRTIRPELQASIHADA